MTYLAEELSQYDEECHEVTRVTGENPVCILPTNVLSGSAHGRRNHFACRVHQQLGQPFKDFLDDLRVGLLQVGDAEADANIGYASGNLTVWLGL